MKKIAALRFCPEMTLVPEHAHVGLVSYDFGQKKSSNFVALLDVYRSNQQICVDDRECHTIKDLRNKLAFAPASGGVSGWSELAKPGTFIAVYFDTRQDESDQEKLLIIPPTVVFEDQMLRSILMAVGHAPQGSALEVEADGYSETLGALLVYELNRLYHRKKYPTIHEGGLSPRQTQRILGYIEENLKDKITVADLANIVELSRFHFIRAFKKSVGVPPYQFIMRRRVARAKEMLADDRLSVTDVALYVGFNGLTQLTRVFRQVVGVTPTTFRRDAS